MTRRIYNAQKKLNKKKSDYKNEPDFSIITLAVLNDILLFQIHTGWTSEMTFGL